MGARVTVDEFLAQMHTKFPRAKDWLIAWADSFRRVLAGREGEDLRAAYERTLDAWNEPGCPKPAHFAANLPPKATAAPGTTKQPFEAADDRRRARARDLERGWTHELRAWFETAKAEGWEGHLRLHVRNLAAWCAQADGDVAGAIAAFNAKDYRGRNTPPRAPDDLVDERDAAIFRARLAGQAKFGRRRVRKESAWMTQRRAELNARIKEGAPA